MKNHPHWDAARNKRFRVVRIDGPSDWCGNKPSYQYDAEKHLLSRNRDGIKGHELSRIAKPKEIPSLEGVTVIE